MNRGGARNFDYSSRRFAAFISYSHADAAIAAKLQRQLERYRLPKHVVETLPGQQAELGKFFRDREDLAAAESLSAAIREALAVADALIVICSPDARKSQWVAQEIELFRALHPERPVLAAVARGEPGEVFPAALTVDGLEPLAADLRKQGDGWSLGFLKIVAGIAGVPLDMLVQRDAQRRLRRVMWITGGALAAMLLMAVMTVFAVQSRNEATRQRAEAEGLVEYMLTDLRTTLRGVGRPELMNDVNRRAMDYYKDQGSILSLPPDSLERRARILHAMGEDYGNSNQPELALASFREAHRTTETLVKLQPDDPDRIFAHAQSEYWMGQAAWRKRDRATTAEYWNGYLKQAQKLLAVDNDKARANLEMGYAHGNLCDLYLNGNFDVPKALENCKKSIFYEEKAASIEPQDREIQIALANRYGWLADTYLAQQEYRKAREAREVEQRIVDALLIGDPKNFELRFRQLWPQFGMVNIGIAEGEIEENVARLKVLGNKLAILSAEAPDNMEVKRAWLRTHYVRAKALLGRDNSAAEAALSDTKTLLQQLAQTPSQAEALAGFTKAVRELHQQIKAGGKQDG